MASPLENGDKAQIIPEDSKMDDKTSKILMVVVAFAGVVSVIALIIAVVGVSNNSAGSFNIDTGGNTVSVGSSGGGSGGSSSGSSGDKIWMFQIGHFGANTQYLDESTGTIRGYDVDVVNAVCQVAGKNCRIVWDLYERCWDSEVGQRARGGDGLMGDWYDACIGWYQTLDRARTFDFSKPLEQSYDIAFFTKAGSSRFTWPNFGGLKVGILDGWWIDEHCIERYEVTGFDKSDASQVMHFPSEEAIIQAVIDDQIQVAFVPVVSQWTANSGVTQTYTPTEDKCANGGPSMMFPKDQEELRTWFNKAFDDLVGSSKYTEICNDIARSHGSQPGLESDGICVN